MDNTLKGGDLYCDRRLGGVERWYIGKPKDADMRIPDDILNTVCFICVVVPSGRGEAVHFIGTGFFISLPSALPNRTFNFLVTARHVIEGAKEAGHTDFFVRLNTKDGKSIVAFIPDDWLYPDNPGVDVAVLPIRIHEPSIEIRHAPAESFATDEAMREFGIGIGDDLVMVGLFSRRWGHQRNIPIVRSGIIASMPDEPFIDDNGHLYDAYLAEMRSIGGLSGSPVFVFLDGFRTYPNVEEFQLRNMRWQLRLIGLIRGHWDLRTQDAADSVDDRGEIDRLNTGIAQVTPIQEVLAILNREELVKERQEKEREALKRHQPTLDSASIPQPVESGGITREGFEEALRRASRKPHSPEAEEGEK